MTCQRGAGGRRGAVAFSAAAAAGLPALLRLRWHHLHRSHDAREWMPWWQPPLSREPWRQELALLRCHAVCLFMCVCAHTFPHQLNYTEAVLFNFILKHSLILISTTRQDSQQQSHIKACVWTGSTHTQTTSQQRKHTNGCSLRPRRLWFKGPQELPITTGHFNQTWEFMQGSVVHYRWQQGSTVTTVGRHEASGSTGQEPRRQVYTSSCSQSSVWNTLLCFWCFLRTIR